MTRNKVKIKKLRRKKRDRRIIPSRVWKYDISPEYGRGLSVDIYARSRSSVDYSIIGEV